MSENGNKPDPAIELQAAVNQVRAELAEQDGGNERPVAISATAECAAEQILQALPAVAPHCDEISDLVREHVEAGMRVMARRYRERITRLMQAVTLNIVPRFGLFPAALEDNALQLLSSSELMLIGAGGADSKEVVGTKNIHRGAVEPIIEPRLDTATNGETAWYLIADQSQAESLVVVMLRGNNSPKIERVDPTNVLGIGYRIYQDVGVAAVGSRGIQRNKGA